MARFVRNKWSLRRWPGSPATVRPAGRVATGIAGPLLVVATALIPALIRFGGPTGRVSGTAQVLAMWGDALGLVALVLLAWAMVMSTRLRLMERLFGGLDRLYNWHRLVGATGFGLTVAHPLAYAQAIGWSHISASLWLSREPVLGFGQISLYVMTPVVMVTLLARTRIRHETFVRIHRILLLAFVFAGLHVLLVDGAIRHSGLLLAYVIGVITVGLIALVGHTLLRRLIHSHL